MTYKEGILSVHVKDGKFDTMVCGSLDSKEWQNIVMQVYSQLSKQILSTNVDKPNNLHNWQPKKF